MDKSNIQVMKVSKMISTFKIAYPYYFKDLTKEDVLGVYAIYEEALKEYNIETINNATKSIIKKSKYMPSIKEIIDECENNKTYVRNNIIEQMRLDGYFKDSLEIEKVYNWLEKGIIPSWLKEEMKKYSKQYITNSNQLLIGE